MDSGVRQLQALVERGRLSPDQARTALGQAQQSGRSPLALLVEQGLLQPGELESARLEVQATWADPSRGP
ncbi:MAG TPA: hypothetical protein DEA08_35745, partial [Planctomycetes bacterium]|nr:hypothetical protein [Planctomycetota bacterium]